VWRIPVRLQQRHDRSTLLLAQREQTRRPRAVQRLHRLVGQHGGRSASIRVAYEPAPFDALVARFAALAPADRVTLLSDSFALMQSGRLPLASYIALLGALPRPTCLAGRTALWTVAAAQLEFLDLALAGTPAQASLHERRAHAAGAAARQARLDAARGDDARPCTCAAR
jgi:hypothetical protein